MRISVFLCGLLSIVQFISGCSSLNGLDAKSDGELTEIMVRTSIYGATIKRATGVVDEHIDRSMGRFIKAKGASILKAIKEISRVNLKEESLIKDIADNFPPQLTREQKIEVIKFYQQGVGAKLVAAVLFDETSSGKTAYQTYFYMNEKKPSLVSDHQYVNGIVDRYNIDALDKFIFSTLIFDQIIKSYSLYPEKDRGVLRSIVERKKIIMNKLKYYFRFHAFYRTLKIIEKLEEEEKIKIMKFVNSSSNKKFAELFSESIKDIIVNRADEIGKKVASKMVTN